MRKAFASILILIIILLTGCDPSSYYFDKNDYIVKIESIELVNYRNENYKMVDSNKETLKFDHKKVEKVEILDSEKIEAFLDDFEEIMFFDSSESVNEPTGYCLIWYLKNSNFIVFSCTMIEEDRAYSMAAEFNSSDEFVCHHADFDSMPQYEDLLKKYFEEYDIE